MELQLRLSQTFTKTLKDAPSDEVSRNAQLLIRAGFVHKEMAGAYAYMPLGKRVIDNISQVVREEMNSIGGEELQMTVLQPKEIWQKTDRWDDDKVDNWFKTKLNNGTELGVGLTHEEPITNMLKPYINSYKDLPVYVYQIQNKFRNELRAKSGVLRGREFLMKDLYSFSRNQQEHDDFYELVSEAYHRIYERLGIGDLTYTTFADGGIFSDYSREFQTLSEAGEDTIYLHRDTGIAINKEVYNNETLVKLGLNKDELEELTASEVGNIFPLGSKYSDALGVFITDENGEKQSVVMGSYGIGVSRLMGIIAEIFSDDKGMSWPERIAPAKVHLVALDGGEGQAERLYGKIKEDGISVIYDDRSISAGQKLADADLMGMPYRVVCSKKTLVNEQYELTRRQDRTTSLLKYEELLKSLY